MVALRLSCGQPDSPALGKIFNSIADQIPGLPPSRLNSVAEGMGMNIIYCKFITIGAHQGVL